MSGLRLNAQFDLEYSKSKPWIKTKNGFFAGAVFVGDRLLSEPDIIKAVESIENGEQATEFVKRLNGHFALAVIIDDKVFLSTDRERTVPIFYEIKDGEVFIYNHVTLDMIKERGINEQALKELENCLFVSGTNTFADGINSVMAGETVLISDDGIERCYYHEFNYEKVDYSDKYKLFNLIDEKFVAATKRLITYLDGRCAVVPLSGGHDSRLIVYYLKRLCYDNIVTYTYGPKGNFEATTSENVAKFLNLKWYCVEYEPKKLKKLFKEKFAEFADYCSNGVSSVCVQDWYAVEYLHQKGVLPTDAVFVPGHSFDCISGSFILPRYAKNDTVTKQELINDILRKHHSEVKMILPQQIRSYYEDNINQALLENEPDVLTSDRAFNLYQNYNVRERQAKYICWQPKNYEYYGYDWYLPLWDAELIDFWETIDIKTKYNRELFFEFTEHMYKDLMQAAPVLNVKDKNYKKVNMNPVVRVFRKIYQLFNYVDFHYCLAYFTQWDVLSIYAKYRVLNIGFFVNQKIIELVRKRK